MPSKCLHRCKYEWEDDERTVEDFILSVLNPHLSKKSLVLCDFWSGHKDEEATGGKDVDLKIIPLKQQNMHNLWTCISSGNIKYMPREKQSLLNYVPVTCSQNCMKDCSSWNSILSFAINYRRKHIDQCFITWQNAGYDIGKLVNNFTSVINMVFSTDIIESLHLHL